MQLINLAMNLAELALGVIGAHAVRTRLAAKRRKARQSAKHRHPSTGARSTSSSSTGR